MAFQHEVANGGSDIQKAETESLKVMMTAATGVETEMATATCVEATGSGDRLQWRSAV